MKHVVLLVLDFDGVLTDNRVQVHALHRGAVPAAPELPDRALHPLPAGGAGPDRGRDGDRPAGGLSPRVHRARRNPVARPHHLWLPFGAEGGSECGANAPQPTTVASVLCDSASALSVPARQGRAEALHRAAGRGCLPPERRAVAPGLPALAERALPAVLRRLLGLPVGADRRRGLRAHAQPAAGDAAQCPYRAGAAVALRHPGAIPAVPPLPRRPARHRRHGRHGHERVRGDDREIAGPQHGGRVRAGRRAGGGLPDRRAVGRRVDGLFVLRPRTSTATVSAAT